MIEFWLRKTPICYWYETYNGIRATEYYSFHKHAFAALMRFIIQNDKYLKGQIIINNEVLENED